MALAPPRYQRSGEGVGGRGKVPQYAVVFVLGIIAAEIRLWHEHGRQPE